MDFTINQILSNLFAVRRNVHSLQRCLSTRHIFLTRLNVLTINSSFFCVFVRKWSYVVMLLTCWWQIYLHIMFLQRESETSLTSPELIMYSTVCVWATFVQCLCGSVPNLGKFPQGDPEISRSQEWDKVTAWKYNASSVCCYQHVKHRHKTVNLVSLAPLLHCVSFTLHLSFITTWIPFTFCLMLCS